MRRNGQLTRVIAVKAAAAVLLTAGLAAAGGLASRRISERVLCSKLIGQYGTAAYDRELCRIAETFAAECCENGGRAEAVKPRSDARFVRHASKDAYIIKYTGVYESDEAFLAAFRSAVRQSTALTAEQLGKCRYIGVGRYEDQVFVLGFYLEP